MNIVIIIFTISFLLLLLLLRIVRRKDNSKDKSKDTSKDKSKDKSKDNITPQPQTKTIKPRPNPVFDCGYNDLPRGWYDIQGQGVNNDFCRFVGNRPDANYTTGGWWSCYLAGTTNAYSGSAVPSGKLNGYNNKVPFDQFIGSEYGCTNK